MTSIVFTIFHIRRPLTILIVVSALLLAGYAAAAASSPPSGGQTMTLAEAIALALRNSRDVETAYLGRVVQKFDLRVAEDRYNPDLTLDASAETGGTETSRTHKAGGTLVGTQRIPTGGQFDLSWAPSLERGDSGSADVDLQNSTWRIAFKQPLLKGAGIDVDTAPVENARIQEQVNILSLKQTVIGLVNAVISAYRSFLRAQQQVDIALTSLERAKASLAVNQLLIDTGRMAAVEIVQTQSDIANKEFSYQQSLNAMDTSRLSLLQILDMDIHRYTDIVAVDEGDIDPVHPVLQECIDMALANRPDYGQALLGLKQRKLERTLAENNMRWTLNLDTAYDYTDTRDQTAGTAASSDAWRVALNVNIPLYGDLSRKQRLTSAQVAEKQQQLAIDELEHNVEVEIRDKVLNVASQLKQLELARLALRLSRQKLEIEQEKLKTGRSSNFQVVTFQNDLVSAQTAESNAVTEYRNALTALDSAIGTTLDTWKISFSAAPDARLYLEP